MIKAAFFDVDNTLYSWKKKEFVLSGIESIKAIQKKGVKVFLCSSRPYHSLKEFGCFSLGIDWDGWVGSSGGVAAYRNKVLYQEVLDYSVGKRFVAFAKNHGLMAQVVTPKTRYYFAEPNEYHAEYVSSFSEPYAPVRPFHRGTLISFLLFAPESIDEEMKRSFPELHFFRFHPYAVDVMPVPHSKGRGLAAILKALGLSADEAIGFGDDDADIDMLDGLTHFVAMGNGKEHVKEAAEFVTTPIDEDGIKTGLAHYSLLD